VHLRSLRLRGFKSFPDPVEIRLEPGVAVVVGPNGSGKSNVADAIVWAAGSLTPSELRAEKPDDVLFAGGGDRKAVDACEVELVFDNEDGGLADLDFAEVSIVRRLARGGEGQYLVNRAPVRRTDLVELLADVGLGGAMHSIVSQGKVDAMLASKPEDRRALIEEAAGLGKFKRRRHRAELKLARVATQVERARDVEDEVRKRLRPLALQATAAERAEKLRHQIARLRARVADLDLAAIAERRAEADDRRAAAALARRAAAERLQALLEERRRAEEELGDAAGRREAAVGSLYRLRSATERLELRRESAAAVAARAHAELGELRRAGETRDDAAIAALEEAFAAAAARSRDAARASGAAAERARIAHERLVAAETALAGAAEARLEELRSRREAAERELAAAAGERQGAGRTLLRLASARERLAVRRESATVLAGRLRAEAADAEAIARSAAPDPAELERAANEAAAVARLAATERDDLSERARAARERVAALERSLAEREGIAPAARALAEAGERLALSLVEAEPGAERAVAAALGARASALVADDPGAGLALLERARGAGLGSLTVLVGADPQALVASLPVVPLGDLLAQHAPAVTTEGFGYDPGRGELWFAGETAEAVLLEQEARRRALADEADELDGRAEAAARAAEEAAERAAAAETAYAEVAHLRGRRVDPDLAARLAARAAAVADTIAAAVDTAARLEAPLRARLDDSSHGAGDLGERLRALGADEADARRAAADAGARAQAAAVVVARLGGSERPVQPSAEADLDELARTAAALLAESEHRAHEAASAADAARVAEAALAERSPRSPSLDPGVVAAVAEGAERLAAVLADAAAAAARFEAPLQARVDAGAARTGELAGELRRLGAAEVEERRRAEEAAERAAAVDVELARLDGEAAEATRRRTEAASAASVQPVRDGGPGNGVPVNREVPPAELELLGDDRDELAAKAERLERRREELGKVNPLAKEEYETEKERLDELAAQREDLERSLAELQALRDELAETVARRFDETFAAVARNFEDVATTLFPGGEGRLRLVEGEDGEEGEPGVEVELRPAGKRVTRLSLLSGGEKALGAISFLFALFLARPCPFYLLDEVEAALDDANIARFVELLRRYADRAQFVVITHQKRTMEAADVLYGVTMGTDGVSEIVSRRLPREREAVAAAS
jgi:chromosome segregation protein